MHNFESGNRDVVSGEEARQVLQAWADQSRASGVDPRVNSVQALSAGLGVSEDEVRRLVEEIRVHRRSHQIAAGILSEERARRKGLDVTAAIGAAVAFIVLALAAGAFFVARSTSSAPAPRSVVVEGIPVPPIPPSFDPERNVVSSIDPDGEVITIDSTGFHEVSEAGIVNLQGKAAEAAVERRIATAEERVARLKAIKSPTDDEQVALEHELSRLNTLQQGLLILRGRHQDSVAPSGR